MKQIKFRGESAIGTVYGFYVEREGKPYIVNDTGTWISVEKESVSQLCGYDVNGEEVYEGDIIVEFVTGEYPTKAEMSCEDDLRFYKKQMKCHNIVEKILKQYMPDASIAYMKWSLNNGKKVHIYGRQGGGKSTIRDMFAKYQYSVTAPEDSKLARREIQSVSREDIEHWWAS